MNYSIAELLDQLNIVNIKIFMLIEKIQNSSKDDNISEEARKVHQLNKIRSELKKEIDIFFTNNSRELKF
jgi:hypothetical protein